jgi:DNA-binding transcriptional MerR regulator
MKEQDDSWLTVGRLARTAQVGVPTLRFYERSGEALRDARRASAVDKDQ